MTPGASPSDVAIVPCISMVPTKSMAAAMPSFISSAVPPPSSSCSHG